MQKDLVPTPILPSPNKIEPQNTEGKNTKQLFIFQVGLPLPCRQSPVQGPGKPFSETAQLQVTMLKRQVLQEKLICIRKGVNKKRISFADANGGKGAQNFAHMSSILYFFN